MKKHSIYVAFILILLTWFGAIQLNQSKVNASVKAKILKIYSPSSDYVQVTKSVRGVTKLVFINKNWDSNYLVKFSKNQILNDEKELKVKLPGNSKSVYFTYVSSGHLKGYIASKFVKSYYYDDNDEDNDSDNSSDTNDDEGNDSDDTVSILTELKRTDPDYFKNAKTTSNETVQSNLNNTQTSNANNSNNKPSENINMTLEQAFEHDLVTSPQEVSNVPWEKSGNQSFIEPLYNGRDIYYHITSTGEFAAAWQRAINDWNNLGVIQFIPTNSTDNNHVLMLGTSSSVPNTKDSNWGGITIANYPNGVPDDTCLKYNNCYLNPSSVLKNNDDYSEHKAEITAEHELGHVLGFEHDQRTYGNEIRRSNMNSGGVKDTPQNDIGAKEQYALSTRYGLSILPNFFKYPYFNFDEVLINYHLQISDNYPIKNKLYNYKTNNYYN